MDCSLPASSVCGILQARTLEQFAISYSRGLSRLRDRTHFCVFCVGRQVLYSRANQEARVQYYNSYFHVLNFTSKNLWKSVFSLIIRVPTYCSQFYPLAYKPKVFTVWPVQEMLADPCSHLTGLARIGREKGPHSEKSESQHAQGVWGAGHGRAGDQGSLRGAPLRPCDVRVSDPRAGCRRRGGVPSGSCPPCGHPGPMVLRPVGLSPAWCLCEVPSMAVLPSSLSLTSPAQGSPLCLFRELTLTVLEFPPFMFRVVAFILLISAFYNFLPCTVFFVFSCHCARAAARL